MVTRKFLVKVTKTSERKPLSLKLLIKQKIMNETNLLSEDYEKANEVKKLEIGTEVIRLYPTVPELA